MRGLFNRFVQVGRVAVINYGPDYGKLCVIVDIIDHNRVLIDGPVTVNGIPRQPLNLKRIVLTKLRIKSLAKGARLGTLTKAFKDEKILEKWNKSSWAKKIHARHNKDNLNDFQRFVVKLAKSKRNRVVAKTLRNLFKKKKKLAKVKVVAKKLQKAGKDLSRKHKRALYVTPATAAKLAARKEKQDKQGKDAAADKKPKEAGEKKPKEKKEKPKKAKPEGRAHLARSRAGKLQKALLTRATAQHDRNVKKRKRQAEKAKSGEAPKKAEKPKEKPAKKQKTKQPAEQGEGGKKAKKEAPKAKKAKKETPKA